MIEFYRNLFEKCYADPAAIRIKNYSESIDNLLKDLEILSNDISSGKISKEQISREIEKTTKPSPLNTFKYKVYRRDFATDSFNEIESLGRLDFESYIRPLTRDEFSSFRPNLKPEIKKQLEFLMFHFEDYYKIMNIIQGVQEE